MMVVIFGNAMLALTTLNNWPSRLPNINPIHGYLGWVRQFHSLDDQQEAIGTAWERINKEAVETLLSSMT